MEKYKKKGCNMRFFSNNKLVGIDERPMGFTGQDMKRPGGGIATREQQ